MNKIFKPIIIISFNEIIYIIVRYIFISIFPVEYFNYFYCGALVGGIWFAIFSKFVDYVESR